MSRLAQRSREAELMEIVPGEPGEVDRTLRELETINRWTLAYRPTLRWLDRVVQAGDRPRLSVLDVACGHGDMLRRIARWAERRGVTVELTGVDRDPDAIQSAMAATPPGAAIRYEVRDVFAMPEDERWDVIVSSLFAHHLFDDALPRFLLWMHGTARTSWLVNDLHRHPIPYHVVRIGTRLAGFGRFVVHDAPVSVARGFTREEWRAILAQAGIDPESVEIRWWMPFRYSVGCLK